VKPVQMLISSIRRDGGTQIRAALDEATVQAYAAAIAAKHELPPSTVFYDGTANWLADGFHRVEAELRNGSKRIRVEVRKGTRRDAILFACGANATHGLPRSNADKRRAVETLLALAASEGSKWSDREVARLARVSHPYVAEVRENIRSTHPVGGNVTTGGASKDSRKSAEVRGERAEEADSSRTTVRERAAEPSSGEADQLGKASTPADDGAQAGDSSASPPNTALRRPALDLLGLDDIDPAWLELVCDVEAALGAFDNHLRQAQADLSPLLGGNISNAVQALRMEAHEIAARARRSVLPKSACKYCKDPDGTAGRRVECSGCHNRGWLTADQLGDVPRELQAGGEAAKVIDQKAGGYVARAAKLKAPGQYAVAVTPPMKQPPKLKVELVDEAGNSEPFEDGGF